MISWVKFYLRVNGTDILVSVAEDLTFLEYLNENCISWREPSVVEMPYAFGYRRYMLNIDPEQEVVLKLKFA